MANSNLIGIWKSDPDDLATQETYGNIKMEFSKTGDLIYTILGKEKDEQMFLVYKTDGNILITDQPSHPQENRTYFSVNGQYLELTFEGITSKFIKIP